MRCPSCDSELKISDRQGVEIDYCPKCRGVWLDRGELDKIIERSAQEIKQIRTSSREVFDDDDDRRYVGESKRYDESGRPKKKSLLSELFDF